MRVQVECKLVQGCFLYIVLGRGGGGGGGGRVLFCRGIGLNNGIAQYLLIRNTIRQSP